MAAAGPFHQTWSSRAFGDHAELVHRKIAAALLGAQQRMVDAHKAGGLSTNHLYGNVFRSVYEILAARFVDAVQNHDGIKMVKVRGYSFVIVEGWLLYPIRYADKLRPPQGVKIRASKLRYAVLVEFGPEPAQETLGPEFDELTEQIEPPSLPEVLEELRGSLEVAVIAFTSSVEAGVMQAFVGQPELVDDCLVWHERIDSIDLTMPEGNEEAAAQGAPGPLGTPAVGQVRFGQGAEPDLTIVAKPRHSPPSAEPSPPTPSIQNDE
jgi:hypothetical protein